MLAEVLLLLDRDEDARIVIFRVLRHAPTDTGAQWFEGVLLARQGRQRDALQRWRRCVERGATDDFTAQARDAIAADSAAVQRIMTSRTLAGVA